MLFPVSKIPKEGFAEAAIIKWFFLPVFMIGFFWLMVVLFSDSNKCAELCEKWGYPDSLFAGGRYQPDSCICMDRTDTDKIVAEADLESGFITKVKRFKRP